MTFAPFRMLSQCGKSNLHGLPIGWRFALWSPIKRNKNLYFTEAYMRQSVDAGVGVGV